MFIHNYVFYILYKNKTSFVIINDDDDDDDNEKIILGRKKIRIV